MGMASLLTTMLWRVSRWGVLGGVIVLPGPFASGLVDGEEEHGAFQAHMALLRVIDVGASVGGACLDDVVDVVPKRAHLEDGDIGVVLHDGLQLVGESARLPVPC